MTHSEALCIVLAFAIALAIPCVGFGQQQVQTADKESKPAACTLVLSPEQPTAADQNLLASRAEELEEGADQTEAGSDRRTAYVTAGVVVVVVAAGVVVAMFAYAMATAFD